MKFNNSDPSVQFEPASGSLERMVQLDDAPVEESLLSLIEERVCRVSPAQPMNADTPTRHQPETISDDGDGSSEKGHNRMVIRLGGNGF